MQSLGAATTIPDGGVRCDALPFRLPIIITSIHTPCAGVLCPCWYGVGVLCILEYMDVMLEELVRFGAVRLRRADLRFVRIA